MGVAEESYGTREKILETALKLFSEKGFLGASTREIAREAGVAEVTLFRYFPSKEKLLEEVIKTYTFLPALKGLLPQIMEMPYEEALTTIARRHLQTLTLRKDMVRIMHSEMLRYPEHVRKIYHAFVDELFETLASYFSEMQRQGILRDFDTNLCGRALLGALFAFFNTQTFLTGKNLKNADAEKAIKEFVSLFVKGTLR